MPTFKYRALDRHGLTVKGQLEVETKAAAVRRLSDRRLDVFHIAEMPPQIRFRLIEKRIGQKDLARYILSLINI